MIFFLKYPPMVLSDQSRHWVGNLGIYLYDSPNSSFSHRILFACIVTRSFCKRQIG